MDCMRMHPYGWKRTRLPVHASSKPTGMTSRDFSITTRIIHTSSVLTLSTYLQLYDADLYNLWVEITQGNVENPSQIIARTFDSRYIHTDLHHRDFLQVAADDPGLKEVYRDDQAVIFEVIVQ